MEVHDCVALSKALNSNGSKLNGFMENTEDVDRIAFESETTGNAYNGIVSSIVQMQ